ncbi:rhodanese-like domain-containing protein [Nonlabens antarcticus]|uniref:rhodanese-like domain-containing protein n=1 Tax=Nonlabens antarcticus TaxID=392714 RepID=UPI0018913758|nr:rhodanese-like domain-containing protein [Nonlabens antarcticus]
MFGIFNNSKNRKIKKYLDQGATLLDVRTSSEFNTGHLQTSKNIPVQSIDQRMSEVDKSKPVIVYCAMGGRSAIATAQLKANGFKVVNAGGIKNVKKQIANK